MSGTKIIPEFLECIRVVMDVWYVCYTHVLEYDLYYTGRYDRRVLSSILQDHMIPQHTRVPVRYVLRALLEYSAAHICTSNSQGLA